MEDLGLVCRDNQQQHTFWNRTARTKLDFFYIDNELTEYFHGSTFDPDVVIGADHVPGQMTLIVPELQIAQIQRRLYATRRLVIKDN